jgi:hypothetical protein
MTAKSIVQAGIVVILVYGLSAVIGNFYCDVEWGDIPEVIDDSGEGSPDEDSNHLTIYYDSDANDANDFTLTWDSNDVATLDVTIAERTVHDICDVTMYGDVEHVIDYNSVDNTVTLDESPEQALKRLFYGMNGIWDPNEYLMSAEIILTGPCQCRHIRTVSAEKNDDGTWSTRCESCGKQVK